MATGNRPAAAGIRRRAGGEPSARALLLSILGQHVIPAGGEAWTATLIGALGANGVEEKAARQALARSEAAGWLTSETEGRYTRWRVTATGRALVTGASSRLTRSLADGTGAPPWDGRWLLVLVRPSDAETGAPARAARNALQARLGFEGFGTLLSGLWVSADRRAEAGARRALADLGLADRAAIFDAALTEPTEIVAEAWDLEAGAAAHDRFLALFADAPGDHGGAVRPADAFVTATRLGHEWQDLLRQAPDLPDELLPAHWPGRRSRERFVSLYRRYHQPAAEFYTALTEREVA